MRGLSTLHCPRPVTHRALLHLQPEVGLKSSQEPARSQPARGEVTGVEPGAQHHQLGRVCVGCEDTQGSAGSSLSIASRYSQL